VYDAEHLAFVLISVSFRFLCIATSTLPFLYYSHNCFLPTPCISLLAQAMPSLPRNRFAIMTIRYTHRKSLARGGSWIAGYRFSMADLFFQSLRLLLHNKTTYTIVTVFSTNDVHRA